jgi:hypothetical protein
MSVRYTVFQGLLNALSDAAVGPVVHALTPALDLPPGVFLVLQDQDIEVLETTMSPVTWQLRHSYQLAACCRSIDPISVYSVLDTAVDTIHDTLITTSHLHPLVESVSLDPFTFSVDYSFGSVPLAILAGQVNLEYLTARSTG